jgi:integrase/recombinase XerD
VIEDLRGLLLAYQHPESGYLFPGRWGRGHINSDSAARILREAFERVRIEGGSTHSFRRTGLTQLSNAGIPLRVIQEISGHNNLEQLQKYLEVKPEQVRGAVAALSMLSHEGGDYVGKWVFTVLTSSGTPKLSFYLSFLAILLCLYSVKVSE